MILSDKQKAMSNRKKLLHTLCIYFCFTAIGISESQPGPTLLDLQLITNTNTQQASAFISGISVGSLVGSLSIGFVYGRWNKTFTISSLLLSLAITATALPWCSPYGLMIVMHGLLGVFKGAFYTVAITEVIRTWAPNSRVYNQILNTCFSLGATLAPPISRPFLAPRNITEKSYNHSNQDFVSLGDVDKLNAFNTSTENQSTRVQFAYLITGSWYLIGSLLFIITHICFGVEKTQKELPVKKVSENTLPRSIIVITIFVIFYMFFCILSGSSSIYSFLVTFAVTYLNWTKTASANLNTVFWLCNMSGRFLAIFYTRFLSPFKHLLLTLLMVILATTGNIISAVNKYDTGIWICTGITGFCVASQLPSLLIWTEESIIRLTPMIVAVFNIAITVPGLVMPPILGYLMQEVSSMWLFYLPLIQFCVLFILLFVSYKWNELVVQPKQKNLEQTLKENSWNE